MELKEITTALYDWADKDNKRSVLCIATERVNETEEGYTLSTSTAINGKKGMIVDALIDIMQDDKGLAEIIKDAALKYIIEHSSPLAVGVVSVKAGKEDDDE